MYRLVGGSFAALGLVAWHRRPDSRSGALMTATGFGLLVSLLLKQVQSGATLTLGEVTEDIWTPFFVALVLSFVTGGRLESQGRPGDRRRVVVVVFVADVFSMLFVEQAGNVLLAFPSETVYSAVDTTQRVMLIAIAIAIVRRDRRTLAGGVPAAAAGPAAERRGRRCMLMFVVAAGHRPRQGPALAAHDRGSRYSLDARRARGVPRRAVRSRLARGGLAQLFRDLGRMRGDGAAGGARAGARRPDARAGLPAPGLARDTPTGRPAVLVPPVTPDRAACRSSTTDREVAAIVYDASLDDDPEMVEAVRAAAAMALENERLLAESEARLAEVQASRQRIVAAGDAERRRLERDLHDGAQQRLVALALQLRMIRSDIRRDPAQAEQLAAAASDELAHSLEELRELARGIHPGVARPRPGLGARVAGGALDGRRPRCRATRREHVPRAVELARVLRRLRGAGQRGQVRRGDRGVGAPVAQHGDGVAIEIADDGVGGADAAHGSGLHGLADRVEALDGRLRVTSPPGAGTVVTAELPCAS